MSLKPRAVNFDEVWSGLKETVQQVVTMGSIKRNVWNERFSDVYSLCVAFPEPLAERLYTETKKLLETHVRNLYTEVSKQGEENLLVEYHRYWIQFSKGTQYLNNLYSYLNSQHIQKQKFSDADLTYGSMQMDMSEQLLEIGELGLEIWQREMIQNYRSAWLESYYKESNRTELPLHQLTTQPPPSRVLFIHLLMLTCTRKRQHYSYMNQFLR